MGQNTQKVHKNFQSTSPERQRSIMTAAVREFASKGFNGANINVIARQAGVSIGSMYSYFESKESLFLIVMEYCLTTLDEALSNIHVTDGVIAAFEDMLRMARATSIKHPEITQIYLDCASQSLVSLSGRLSNAAESVTIKLYKDILINDKAVGRVRRDLDIDSTAFMLDNLVMMYQFSFASDYFSERKKLFFGSLDVSDSDETIREMVDFVRRAVEPDDIREE
ncbi:MAG: TetR/AcrR family transcriptional regulator [Clostridia bacterium]